MPRQILNPGPFTVGYNWGNVPGEFIPALWKAQLEFTKYIHGLTWEPRDATADWTVAYTWEPLSGKRLAECYYFWATGVDGAGLAMDMNINSNFEDEFRSGYQDLYSVAVHELGHAFGLKHNTDRISAMYPYLSGEIPGLHPMDVNALARWGWRIYARRWRGGRRGRGGR
jgi:hypothetical protein